MPQKKKSRQLIARKRFSITRTNSLGSLRYNLPKVSANGLEQLDKRSKNTTQGDRAAKEELWHAIQTAYEALTKPEHHVQASTTHWDDLIMNLRRGEKIVFRSG
jgi:hypothetical protein